MMNARPDEVVGVWVCWWYMEVEVSQRVEGAGPQVSVCMAGGSRCMYAGCVGLMGVHEG